MADNTYRLTFGKHMNLCLNEVPFGYVMWLTGWGRSYKGDKIQSMAEKIFEDRSADCGCASKGNHNKSCLNFSLRDTLEVTYNQLKDDIVKDKIILKDFVFIKAWITTNTRHPKAVEGARKYILDNKLCWKCGFHLGDESEVKIDDLWFTSKVIDTQKVKILHKHCALNIIS